MSTLSVLIPARNEEWLPNTVADVLAHAEGDIEVIVVLDGYVPEQSLPQDPRVRVVTRPEPIGQRAATNLAAALAHGEVVMKADAHCSFDQGFDVKLLAEFEPEWTVVPQMRNLHVFDWRCACGNVMYQGPEIETCPQCHQPGPFERVVVWQPREGTRSNFMRFDSQLHFQYWREFKTRPEAKGDIADTMSLVGAAWLMRRERYWQLGGMDEQHGSWGQMGTEISCKTWLSGGRLVVNKRTWFAHMFRTRAGFSFPYPMSGRDQDQAVAYSQWLWRGNRWPGAIHPLSWLIERFWPIPGWTEGDLEALRQQAVTA